jgi:hypothetical protein
MLIQYASDLHIDTWPPSTPFTSFLYPCVPFLVLAGDICSAWDPRFTLFLDWCSTHWKTIILVAGNHEYHNSSNKTIFETDQHIYELCKKYKHIHYLQYGMSYKPHGTNIRFVGSTLWSAPDASVWKKAAAKKSDYEKIFIQADDRLRKLHPRDVYMMHALHKVFLADALQPENPTESIVAITHYLPSKKLLEPQFVGEEYHTFYASDDDDLFGSHVKLWICGHGHRGTSLKTESGTILAMNARGYNRESEISRTIDLYNPVACQKID